MVQVNLDARTVRSLQQAIARNPQTVRTQVGSFLTHGIATFNRQILRSPWRVGGSGGGAPVDSGNLRDTHQREVSAFSARIFPTAKYAEYVHEGTRHMGERPWLDHAVQNSKNEIQQLESTLLTNIVSDLAK